MAKEIDKIIQSKTAPKSNNVLWDDGENLKINRNGKWESTGGGAPMINITYANLVELRNNNKLIAGMQYRITDYKTTTAQENTQSAGHQFDVIVTADNENTLNEVARVCLHEGDIYFSEAGANLAAWQIWYSLDNDVERFAWAMMPPLYSPITKSKMIMVKNADDETYIYIRSTDYDENGKCAWLYTTYGDSMSFLELVEYGKESVDIEDRIYTDSEYLTIGDVLNTDFGNVTLVDISYVEGKGVIYRMIDEWNNDCPYDFKNIQFTRELESRVYCYTFGKDTDYSINGSNYGNVIKEYRRDDKIQLNNIVFLSSNCYFNIFGNNCYNNTFGSNCFYNSFGISCSDNNFGNYCCHNSLGTYCYGNNFSDDCIKITLGSNCGRIFLEKGCYDNAFGNGCYGNSLGHHCYNNSLGDNCRGVVLSQETGLKNAFVNSNNETKIFNLGDLADLLNS